MSNQIGIQGALFEEDYLVRTIGSIANSPDVALTELVANAWDSGASRVDITIPKEYFKELVVEDNGTGMTPEQFKHRWMTLGYNRLRHQGEWAEFPINKTGLKRRAYGRNGVGRHGMLCFGNEYAVVTCRDGKGAKFVIASASGSEAITLLKEEPFDNNIHGTKLIVKPERNLPSETFIRDILSARFLSDPQFQVFVNGKNIPLEEIKGLIAQAQLKVNNNVKIEAFFIDSSKSARTTQQHGVAFWVGGRLVGEPSWIIGEYAVDGRTWVAKRHTVIVKTNDLFNEVKSDWSAFKRSPIVEKMYKVVAKYVESVIHNLMSKKVNDTKKWILNEHKTEISELRHVSKLEVAEFLEELMTKQPTINHDLLSAAVKAVINLEKSRTGVELLQKLSLLSIQDAEGFVDSQINPAQILK